MKLNNTRNQHFNFYSILIKKLGQNVNKSICINWYSRFWSGLYSCFAIYIVPNNNNMPNSMLSYLKMTYKWAQ